MIPQALVNIRALRNQYAILSALYCTCAEPLARTRILIALDETQDLLREHGHRLEDPPPEIDARLIAEDAGRKPDDG